MDTINRAGVWIMIGAGMGIAFGSLFNQVGLGITIGGALGLVAGRIIPTADMHTQEGNF